MCRGRWARPTSKDSDTHSQCESDEGTQSCSLHNAPTAAFSVCVRVLLRYGLDSDRYLGPVDGLLKTEHLHKMRQWCEDDEEDPSCMGRGGWAIPPCVGEPLIRVYK